jgi:ribosomal protein S18 acetylase RimI-like enzyme
MFAALPAEARTALVRSQFDIQRGQYLSVYDNARFLAVIEGDTVVGRLCLADAGSDLLLVDILIGRDRRGRGIGTAILGGLIDRVRDRGAGILLQVRPDNPARSLYRRLGFRVVEEHATGWRMEWRA